MFVSDLRYYRCFLIMLASSCIVLKLDRHLLNIAKYEQMRREINICTLSNVDSVHIRRRFW